MSAEQDDKAGKTPHHNVVKDGGIARSDADVADVGRDTSDAPIGEGGTGPTSAPEPSPAFRRADDELSEAIEKTAKDRKPDKPA